MTWNLLPALAATVAMALALRAWLALDAVFVAKALLAAALAAAALLALARTSGAAASFRAADRVTLARGCLVVLVVATIGPPASAPTASVAAALAALALALDGVDGWVARRRGAASAFGARFDMETDALLILALAVLAWQHGKAGPWVLAAGLMRYAFVAAGAVLPWLRGTLPPSRRRQGVCVVQTLALIACVSPALPTPWSAAVAAAGLAALAGSFTLDTVSLARAARAAPGGMRPC